MPKKMYNGIMIDYGRDSLIPEQGLAMMTKSGFYKKEHEESPQESFARMVTCFSFGDYELAQRLYDARSLNWFTGASPVQSTAMDVEWPKFTEEQFKEAGDWLEKNVKATDGLPISCFLSLVSDDKESLLRTSDECRRLSMSGGGLGVKFGNRSPDEKSTGVLAHLKGYDADALAYKQSKSRRGSIGAYLDIDHPEILNFMEVRNPVGGEVIKKCFNINNGVMITDAFMEAMIKGEDYPLVDPKHGLTGTKLNARKVWYNLMELRKDTGEPFIAFVDTINRNLPSQIMNPTYRCIQSNLCVAPETKILTSTGYESIVDLEGDTVQVWNGEEWSETTVMKTGENQQLLKITTNAGFSLDCTPYHKFYVSVRNNTSGRTKIIEKRAHELKEGDKLIKCDFPVIEGDKVLDHAWDNGFYSGDGCSHRNDQIVYLYGEKRKLKNYFTAPFNSWSIQEKQDREIGRTRSLKPKFFVPTNEYDIKSRLEWFAGICDSDGTIACNGKTQSIQIGSIEYGFLQEVQLMLQTLGVSSKVTKAASAGYRKLPLNDGSGELGDFYCQEAYRLLVGQTGICKLRELGFKTHRLEVTDHVPNRECSHFVKVVSVEDEGRVDDTYCFTEPKRNMGVFNGILTGQCSEITLMTSKKRTAVCCLSSVNLATYEEWKDTTLIADLTRFLDNVLEYFVRLAPKELSRAVYSAKKERALGLGTLGWHSYLQSKMIPLESGGFDSAVHHTHQIFGSIKSQAVTESKRLAVLRGEAPDCVGSGFRNSHLMALAPNASTADLVGASPTTEPYDSNAYLAQGRAGSFSKKNPYLTKLLEEKGKNTTEVWKSIISNDGSVQHLQFLTEEEKKVFKTAREIDPTWLVELCAARQEHVCQAQSFNIWCRKGITAQQMSDIHVLGWMKGIKTFYYARGEDTTKASVGDGGKEPLNAVPVDFKVEFNDCLGCDG